MTDGRQMEAADSAPRTEGEEVRRRVAGGSRREIVPLYIYLSRVLGERRTGPEKKSHRDLAPGDRNWPRRI